MLLYRTPAVVSQTVIPIFASSAFASTSSSGVRVPVPPLRGFGSTRLTRFGSTFTASTFGSSRTACSLSPMVRVPLRTGDFSLRRSVAHSPTCTCTAAASPMPFAIIIKSLRVMVTNPDMIGAFSLAPSFLFQRAMEDLRMVFAIFILILLKRFLLSPPSPTAGEAATPPNDAAAEMGHDRQKSCYRDLLWGPQR